MKFVLATAVLAAALTVPAAFAATPTLKASVGPGFTVSLTKGGTKVSLLKAGTYKVVVTDSASIHNFHLTGPGVNKSTSIGGTGTSTWKVTLKKGKYSYVCDAHSSSMFGSFTVK